VSSTITNYSNAINIGFPIAGVDNDSQGFRTNFSKIQSALGVASTEISNLQLSVSSPADLILNNYEPFEVFNKGDVDDGTMVFLTGNFNKPAYYNNNKWHVFTGTGITLTGSSYIEDAADVNATGRLLLSSSQLLTNRGTSNLYATASYFNTTAASTATLAAGTAGLIKTFIMSADGGDMVITVTNAGWKSSGTGTMTFSNIGNGCTLQYINSKWYCIGNNGVAFG